MLIQRLQANSGYYMLLHLSTDYYRLLKVTTWCYRLLQVTAGYFRLLQVTTGYYKHIYQADKWLQIRQFIASYCLAIYRGRSFCWVVTTLVWWSAFCGAVEQLVLVLVTKCPSWGSDWVTAVFISRVEKLDLIAGGNCDFYHIISWSHLLYV